MKYEKKNGWTKVSEEEKKDIFKFCEGYKSFLNKGKTERECINYAIIKAEANGFKNLNDVNILKPGDKVYAVNKNKSILLAVIGKKSMAEGVHMVGAHVDCPRIDLKQNPLYEDGEVAYFKTHYYGGIKKYQWNAIPLALHGVICKSDGTQIGIAIGDEGDDVTFTITDLLPHLGGEQMNKPAHSFIEGENLNIVVGSIPLKDEEKEPIKTAILKLLNQKYGIVEEDFVSAEIEVVPAFKAKDVGFDRGLIGAYGQDDRVCAYTALEAILNVKSPEHTAVCYLVDKEEVGSMGNTGAKSHFYEDTIAEMIAKSEDYSDLLVRRCMQNSKCL
ncbi:MAG: aminopeptidase, partial [Clostridiaceae bacterium]|nr:aminopeptidase [Clostridiaceae bacterium]